MERRAFLHTVAGDFVTAPLAAEGRQLCLVTVDPGTARSSSALAVAKEELRVAVERAMAYLMAIVKSTPSSPVNVDGFTMLLARAKELFPESGTISKCLKPLARDCSIDERSVQTLDSRRANTARRHGVRSGRRVPPPCPVIARGRPGMREQWWMHTGDVAVRLAWKLLWSWRQKTPAPSDQQGGSEGGATL